MSTLRSAGATIVLLVTTAARADQPRVQLGIAGSLGCPLGNTNADPLPPVLASLYLRAGQLGLTAERAPGHRDLQLDYYLPLFEAGRPGNPGRPQLALRWKLGRVWAEDDRTGALAALALSVRRPGELHTGLAVPFEMQLELRATRLPSAEAPTVAIEGPGRLSRDHDVSWMLLYTLSFGLAWQ